MSKLYLSDLMVQPDGMMGSLGGRSSFGNFDIQWFYCKSYRLMIQEMLNLKFP